MSEADLMRALQIRATRLGARLFRQNSGVAWAGHVEQCGGSPRTVRLVPGDVIVRKARPLHAGFAGMSDLGGWVRVAVSPDMVGQTVAVYTQCEIKTGHNRMTREQRAWIAAVNEAGGRAGVARSADDLDRLVSGDARLT